MINRKPEGYKDLLAYQKAAELQRLTVQTTDRFPRTETMLKLKDQMDRSARSGTKNIVEGWKRNTTSEYFRFLGYAIASIEELKDDCADIATGIYRDLMGVKGVMGEVKGVMGGGITEKSSSPFISVPPLTPLKPFSPFKSWAEAELTNLRFYPLDTNLPPAVQLYLRCKEVLMLLNKLQKSLDTKMDKEGTKSVAEKYRQKQAETKNYHKWVLDETKKLGLVQLEDGRFVKKENADTA